MLRKMWNKQAKSSSYEFGAILWCVYGQMARPAALEPGSLAAEQLITVYREVFRARETPG